MPQLSSARQSQHTLIAKWSFQKCTTHNIFCSVNDIRISTDILSSLYKGNVFALRASGCSRPTGPSTRSGSSHSWKPMTLEHQNCFLLLSLILSLFHYFSIKLFLISKSAMHQFRSKLSSVACMFTTSYSEVSCIVMGLAGALDQMPCAITTTTLDLHKYWSAIRTLEAAGNVALVDQLLVFLSPCVCFCRP